jgi:hypothetical protein
MDGDEIQVKLLEEIRSQNILLGKIIEQENTISRNLAEFATFRVNEQRKVAIRDVDLPIGSMIVLMLKWLVASIPVGIVIGLFWFLLTVVFGSLFNIF